MITLKGFGLPYVILLGMLFYTRSGPLDPHFLQADDAQEAYRLAAQAMLKKLVTRTKATMNCLKLKLSQKRLFCPVNLHIMQRLS